MEILSLEKSYRYLCNHYNKSQNNMISPIVFDDFYNVVTNFLIDEGAKRYAVDQDVVDLLRPFTVTKKVPIINGFIELPKEYRRLISIGIFTDNSGNYNCNCTDETKEEDCEDDNPLSKTKEQLELQLVKKQCNIVPVTVLNNNEWDKRTQSSYKKPNYTNPIACFFDSNKIRICPYDISGVELRYLKHPKTYKFGYDKLPDDTYKFNLTKSEESEWELNATQYLFKGLSHLYADYAKDTEMMQSVINLQKIGIFD